MAVNTFSSRLHMCLSYIYLHVQFSSVNVCLCECMRECKREKKRENIVKEREIAADE